LDRFSPGLNGPFSCRNPFTAALLGKGMNMLKNLLIYRFAIFNTMMIALLLVAKERGLLHYIYVHDTTFITVGVTALFIVGWFATLKHVMKTSRLLNELKKMNLAGAGHGFPVAWGNKVRAKTAWLNDVSNWLVGLGLVGTVVGFTVALSGIDQDLLTQAAGVQTSVGKLMDGMRIALNTTIAGAVLGMWNEVNQRMLHTAQECMISDLEAGG
jgi:hypothetical protein